MTSFLDMNEDELRDLVRRQRKRFSAASRRDAREIVTLRQGLRLVILKAEEGSDLESVAASAMLNADAARKRHY